MTAAHPVRASGESPVLRLRDVTLRDGLQNEAPISTKDKIRLFEALFNAGLRELEVASFVRPDLVPAMADAEQLVAAVGGEPAELWGLVMNVHGLRRALEAGLRHVEFVVSVSEEHNLRNAGRSVRDSLLQLALVKEEADAARAEIEVTIATAFGCPYTGVLASDVHALIRRLQEMDVTRLTLADTIGSATPNDVKSLLADLPRFGSVPLELRGHFHDTRGLGMANALAALELGVTRFDGSVGGLGGCPFAPGAAGNLALEDLAHALEAIGYRTGIDVLALSGVAELACGLVGRAVGSHIGVAGPRGW